MTVEGLKKRINLLIWKQRKKAATKKYYSLLNGDRSGISIISCNCIGGIVMSELGMQFMTPTVNLFLSAHDFIAFAERLQEYLHMTPEDGGRSPEGYPLAKIGDLTIHAVHYHDINEFIQTWNRRKKRVNYDNLFFIFTDRDGFTPDIIDRINALPYEKVLFTKCEYQGYNFVCKVPGFEDSECVGALSDFVGISGKRLYSIYPFAQKLCELSLAACRRVDVLDNH